MSICALNWALNAQVANSSQKLVLLLLANFSDDQGRSWPSQKVIAEKASLSVRSVVTALAELEKAGRIRREARWRSGGSRSTDIIHLVMSPGGEQHSCDQSNGEKSAPMTKGAKSADQRCKISAAKSANPSPLTTFEPSLNHQGNRQLCDVTRDAHPDPDGEDEASTNADLIAKGRADRLAAIERGVALICANTSRPEGAARSLMGHLLGIARDEVHIVLAAIEDADGRELADFSTRVIARLRQRRDGQDHRPERGRSSEPPRGYAARLIRLRSELQEGPYDVEPPAIDANGPDAEPDRGEDRGVAWASGGPSRPSDALLRAVGQGGHDSRAASHLRRRRAAGG